MGLLLKLYIILLFYIKKTLAYELRLKDEKKT